MDGLKIKKDVRCSMNRTDDWGTCLVIREEVVNNVGIRDYCVHVLYG